jgi:hypothetical protein
MTEPVMDFRLGPDGEFALRVGNATAEWHVARLQPTAIQVTDESVEDWIKLIPAEVVGHLARQVQVDLAKVQVAAEKLGEAHDASVAELKEENYKLDLQVQAMRDFALELSSEPLAGRYFASEINRRLDEAAP